MKTPATFSAKGAGLARGRGLWGWGQWGLGLPSLQQPRPQGGRVLGKGSALRFLGVSFRTKMKSFKWFLVKYFSLLSSSPCLKLI